MNYFFRGRFKIDLEKYITRYQLAFQSINRSVNNMIKQHVHTDITTDQFTILQFIHQEEKVTATEIAQHFGLGKSAITAYVNRLMQKDLLQRERNDRDRRIIYLSLTEHGKKVVTITEKEIHYFIEEKLTHFDMKEVEKFLHALERLSDLMEAEERNKE